MIFGVSILVYIVGSFLRSFIILTLLLVSTTNLHKAIVEKIVRSKILFFDSNPIGRIFTRFSKDITTLDLVLPPIFNLATFVGFRSLSVFLMIIVVFPWMVIALAVVVFFMVYIVKKALKPIRECLRMDAIYRGPIHQQFSMIVNGLVSLRQYERISYFREIFINDLEKSTNVCFCYYIINRWMGIHQDFLCILFSLCASSFAVFMKGQVANELLAFCLQSLTDMLMFFSFALRYSAEIESYLTSA